MDYHVFKWNEVKMHHLSWLRADIRKKLNMWSSKKCFDNYNDLIDRAVDSFVNFDETSEQAKALMLFNTPGNTVDVKAFPKQYIHPKVDFNTRLRKVKNYKKLLVLTMSADFELFNHLETVANKTWRNIDTDKFNNINAEFWTYTDAEEGKDTYVDKDKHIIYIKKDYSIDGYYQTFSKTVFAFREIKKMNIDYDYLVRTNNSIWLNIPLLNEFLSYQEDNSLIFTGRIYGSFWSAFNLYAGGELMVFPKRNIDIIDDLAKDPVAFEKSVKGCDDNLIFGLWNKRLSSLNLRESDYLHSFEDAQHISKDIAGTYDFAQVAYQMKTYGCTEEQRIKYDTDKINAIDTAWKNNTENIDSLLERMLSTYYDKYIHVIPADKNEWVTYTEDDRHYAKFKHYIDRTQGLIYLAKRQKQCGYTQTLI